MAKGWANKTKWSAAEWREYRRSKGVEQQDDRQTRIPPEVYTRGREIVAMMALPLLDWDEKLFADANTTAPLFAPKAKTDHLCKCGCGNEHKFAVPRVIGETNSRKVLWYRTMVCRNYHAAKGNVS